jgi:hypothetical protein
MKTRVAEWPTHDADKRKNIPTAEYQSVVKEEAKNIKAPLPIFLPLIFLPKTSPWTWPGPCEPN